MPKKRKKKKYIPVIRIDGSRKTYMEFGIVENPIFGNDIYMDIVSAHKGGSGSCELRTDEALVYIQALGACVRRNLTGVSLVLQENKEVNKKHKK